MRHLSLIKLRRRAIVLPTAAVMAPINSNETVTIPLRVQKRVHRAWKHFIQGGELIQLLG